MDAKRVLVTGGAGFLGSHFVRHALNEGASAVTNLDLLTYAGDERRLSDLDEDDRYRLIRADIAAADEVAAVMEAVNPEVVVHFAAESHVTRSESAPDLFHRTNVEGTQVMLEESLRTGVDLFLHVSTDEIYGPILDGAFREEDKQSGDAQASSPYAKSKAIADDLARSYSDRIPLIVARPTNAFGPYQFPEKAFARWVTRALRGEVVPVWGDGLYIRQWLYAEDFAGAIALLIQKGNHGEVYNVGPLHEPEITNLDLARWLIEQLELPEDRLQMTAYDRPDHDRRYSVDASKLRSLGWKPGDVWAQFASTVEWYEDHTDWWEPHVSEAESIYIDAGGT